MRVEYAGIELEDVSLQGWEREAVLNGPDYLYTRFKLHVKGIFNPFSTSYRLATVPGTPNSEKGQLAALTDQAIRHRLLQARQQLYVWMDQGDLNGRSYMLVSPLPISPTQPTGAHYPTDANNGPFPVACNVYQMGGTKTFLVDFIIQTDINECQLGVSNPGVVISHRWAMEDDIDFQFLTTRTIRGKIVLSTDRMLSQQKDADDFRKLIVHPVNTNMQRLEVKVVDKEDGNTLEYEITDRELQFNIGEDAKKAGVVRIEGEHTVGLFNYTSEIVLGAAQGGLDVASDISGRRVPGQNLGRGTILATVAGAMLGAAREAQKSAPRLINRCSVRVWGSRNSTRRGLDDAARNILASRLVAFPGTGIATIKFFSTHHLHDKLVEMYGEWVTGPFSTAVQRVKFFGFADGTGIALNSSLVPDNEEIPGQLTQLSVTNPNLPNDEGSRGTFARQLLAAVLRSPCQNTDNTKPPAATS